MAELSKADLDKRGNDEIIINKFFNQKKLINIFLHKDGQFKPITMIFVEEGDEVDVFETVENVRLDEALARIKRYSNRKKNTDKVLFTGKFLNTNQIKTVPLTEMIKTEEFGGQTGGKKINLGIQFENKFYESLMCELSCSSKNTAYSN